jgi:hypothetical protein
MKWLIQRLSEPSSYAGFAAALQAIYMGISGHMDPGMAVATGVAGALAFVKSDKPTQG